MAFESGNVDRALGERALQLGHMHCMRSQKEPDNLFRFRSGRARGTNTRLATGGSGQTRRNGL